MMISRTNIGHTGATSGLASIIKTVMAVEKRRIPPSLNFDQPNPNIPFSDLGIKVSASFYYIQKPFGCYKLSITCEN